jgi:hypothetical protein
MGFSWVLNEMISIKTSEHSEPWGSHYIGLTASINIHARPSVPVCYSLEFWNTRIFIRVNGFLCDHIPKVGNREVDVQAHWYSKWMSRFNVIQSGLKRSMLPRSTLPGQCYPESPSRFNVNQSVLLGSMLFRVDLKDQCYPEVHFQVNVIQRVLPGSMLTKVYF